MPSYCRYMPNVKAHDYCKIIAQLKYQMVIFKSIKPICKIVFSITFIYIKMLGIKSLSHGRDLADVSDTN